MMTISEINITKEYLKTLGFIPLEGEKNVWLKKYNNFNYEIKVFIDEKNLEKSKIDFGSKISIERATTTNLKQSENLVVLECINRLLEKGYKPENLTLEKSWQLGHKGKGWLDIWVRDSDSKSYLMIECKTWGEEYNKEKYKMFKDGGQLVSYLIQEPDTKFICLYTSKTENGKTIFQNEIVANQKDFKGKNQEEIFEAWDKTFETKGIFEDETQPYGIEFSGILEGELRDIEASDGGIIFNQFAEILRRHIVSDKTNAFNKIFNLFICKIVDEDEKYATNKELDFQWKKADEKEDKKYEIFFDRLHNLYKKGVKNYIDIDVADIEEGDLKMLSENTDKEKIEDIITKLRFYTNNEFAFKEVYNKETFDENAEVVKEIVELLQPYRIKYSKKHQYLGDFFENLLNTGIKQEVGQFFTPIPLAKFICRSLPVGEIIQMKNNKEEQNFLPYVIDFASGSGHFLTEMMDEIECHIKNISPDNIKGGRRAKEQFQAIKDNFKWAKEYVYGIEKDYRLAKTTKVSTFLNGDGDATIISGDGLDNFYSSEKYKGILKSNDSKNLDNQVFDILVANPPYSVSGFKNNLNSGSQSFELFDSLTDKSSEIECLFIERTKQLLKEKSVAGIILPISILTNAGIYEKTRDIILKYFKIRGIVTLGSNAFMATGTKTVVLFIERRSNDEWRIISDIVDNFFKTYANSNCNGIENAFSVYVSETFEDIEFNDYISILKNSPTEKAKKSELYIEYANNKYSIEKIIANEKKKILYFVLSYPQKVILGKSGEENNVEKSFYGYEFSSRRGHEGIQLSKNESGFLESKMYNEEEIIDAEKLNSYILRNFNGENLDEEITAIKKTQNTP